MGSNAKRQRCVLKTRIDLGPTVVEGLPLHVHAQGDEIYVWWLRRPTIAENAAEVRAFATGETVFHVFWRWS